MDAQSRFYSRYPIQSTVRVLRTTHLEAEMSDIKKEQHKKSKGKTPKTEKVTRSSKDSAKPKTITRVSHVPMQSVKMIKMGGAVIGQTTFSAQDYSINAGNAALWPRLAQVARTYQYWKAVNWHVKYEPIASMFGANKSGVVTLSLLENWYDAKPDTMTAQTERARRSVTVPAWESATLRLDPTRWKYVRDSPGSQGQDMRLDDEVIEVGVEGTDAAAAGQAIGYLYITADIEFRVPYTVSMLNAPRSNTVFVAMRPNDVLLASSPAGVSTGLGFSGATVLDNSFYTGASLDSGVVILQGGTYSVTCIGSFSCASVPCYVCLSFAATGANQLIQPEGASSRPGCELNLTVASGNNELISECVTSVPEGQTASLVPSALCIQAASANVTLHGLWIKIVPH